MLEQRSTLAEVAERIRKSPRWLREKLKTLPPVGDRFGRSITFTAAQERTLIDLIQQQQTPVMTSLSGRTKAVRWRPYDDRFEEAMRLAREKPEKQRGRTSSRPCASKPGRNRPR